MALFISRPLRAFTRVKLLDNQSMESRHNCQIDHNGATQYAVWWNMLIAAGVEKVKRQWLQLKPDQASWAQNSDMELVKPMMVLYMDGGDVVVITGVVEC